MKIIKFTTQHVMSGSILSFPFEIVGLRTAQREAALDPAYGRPGSRTIGSGGESLPEAEP
jgi:hypothetical protein